MSHDAQVIAIVITVGVHLIGAAVLVWLMLDGDEERPDWRALWPRDDDGGTPPPDAGAPRPSGPGVPLLPDADQSTVRLREPGRIADAHPRPARRPDHAPEPAREPATFDG